MHRAAIISEPSTSMRVSSSLGRSKTHLVNSQCYIRAAHLVYLVTVWIGYMDYGILRYVAPCQVENDLMRPIDSQLLCWINPPFPVQNTASYGTSCAYEPDPWTS
ncbi:hypothetical protein BT96DRAFT_147239 [Gymnopus androsaceus JB14]|uniref:Uncharacterized protein n=1 Tax=Gymnopus androsaceus JB14 TaxID=1447944 RepID=A0A6A4HCB1_9AGAR|nr:hypothetical protein BT96DRAFT_147239 [Gymnopus androsaceus JB14]